MKKIILGLGLIGALAIFDSCKSGASSSPTAALKAMAEDSKKALSANGDIKSITKSMCKADREMMEKMWPMIESFAKLAGKDFKELAKEKMKENGQFDFDNVEFSNEKINGDVATVDVTNKKENKTETINFTKEGGEWKMCMGIAEKAGEAMRGEGGMPNLGAALDTLNTPKVQEALKNVGEELKKIKPEDLEKIQKMGAEMQKNMKPEDLEKLKKLAEQMGGKQ